MPTFGNIMGEDPLGIALKDRAQQSRQDYNLNEGWGHPMGGPLPDPAWQGLFQALNEVGADRLVGGAVPGSRAFTGVKSLPGMYGAVEVNAGRGIAPATGERSMLPGYGAPDNRAAIINGLHQAYTPSYQAPEQQAPGVGAWQAQRSNAPRRGRMTIQDQRGTQGLNQSQRYRQPNPNEE